ncbi:MAG: murein L,D-transpeptidase catalytic domain family protein [Chitinophagaceae bacterium]|nr:murein L,D-transpeptidase catalytic domain family protein [Chitinophagaceae bacterium]
MSIPSGNQRFFVYNLKKDSIIHSGLVTHGSCNEYFLEGRKYSNVEGSGCTSLGKYKIGKPYYGKFGLAWKLHGLDAANSNAYKRYVVLHSHDCVPDAEMEEELLSKPWLPHRFSKLPQDIKANAQ